MFTEIFTLKTQSLKSILLITGATTFFVLFISGLFYTKNAKGLSCYEIGYSIKGRILIRNNSFYNVSDTLVLEGRYNGKNLYLVNPMDGPGKCSFHKIFVNGKTPTGPESYGTGFTVNLDSCNLGLGDKVKIEILHERGQVPKALNPEVLK